MPFDFERILNAGLSAVEEKESSKEGKDALKAELRSFYVGFFEKLEALRLLVQEKYGSLTNEDFNTVEKIREAEQSLDEYQRVYGIEFTVLETKKQELSGALTQEEILHIEKDYESKLRDLSLILEEIGKDKKFLNQQKATLGVSSTEIPPDPQAEAGAEKPELLPVLNTPETISDPKVALNEARKNYLKAKRELEKFSGLMGSLKGFFSKSSKEKVDGEHKKAQEVYEKAQKVYQKAQAEYIGASWERAWQEKNKLVEEKIVQQLPERGFIKKGYDGYKKLGELNLTNLIEKGLTVKGREIVKARGRIENKWLRAAGNAASVRTAISASLMGYGWVGARVGLSAGSVLATVLARRAVGGIGYYDLQNMAFDKATDKFGIKKHLKNNADFETLSADLAALQGRAILDGKTLEKMQQDELYKELSAKVEQMTKDYFSGLSPEKLEDELSSMLSKADASVDKSMKKVKIIRRVVGGVSMAAAGLMDNHAIGEYIEHKRKIAEVAKDAAHGAGPHLPKADTPGTARETHRVTVSSKDDTLGSAKNEMAKGSQGVSASFSVESAANHAEHFNSQRIDLPKGAWAETTADGGLKIHAGGRGIEGALLDLQKANKPAFDKMMDVLKNDAKIGHTATGTQITDPGKLVHRYVDAYAKQHDDYNFGKGGAHDLNHMSEAQMNVDSTGQINFDSEHMHFIQSPEHAVVSPLTHEAITPEAVEAPDHFNLQGTTQTESLQTASSTVEDATNTAWKDLPGNPWRPFEAWHHFGEGNAVPGENLPHTGQPLVPYHPEVYGHPDHPVEINNHLENFSPNETANIHQALEIKDLTQSLKLVYEDQYTKLFKLGHFKPSDLKKVQNIKLGEFLGHCDKDPKKFGKKFKFLHDSIIGERQQHGDINMNMGVKEFLIKYSSDIKEDLKGFK